MIRFRVSSVLLFNLLVLAVQPSFQFDISFGDVTEIMKFTRETVTDVLESWEWIRPKLPNENGENDFPFVKRMEKRLMDRINIVSQQLDSVENRIEQRTEAMVAKILEEIPERQRLEKAIHDLYKSIGQIESLYQNFVEYARSPNKYNPYTIKDFAKTAVSHRLGDLRDVLESIYRQVVPQQFDIFEQSVLQMLANRMKVNFYERLKALTSYLFIHIFDINSNNFTLFSKLLKVLKLLIDVSSGI